jgi:hypothetical protein
MIAKFTPQGNLDTSFGSLGWVLAPLSPDAEVFTRGAMDRQGRIVVSGVSGINEMSKLILFRYLQDGTLETSFLDAIRQHPNFACDYYGADHLTIDAADRPMIAGYVGRLDKYDAMACRFLAEPLEANSTAPADSSPAASPLVERLSELVTPQVVERARERTRAIGTPQSIRYLAISPLGDVVATCGYNDHHVRVLEVATGRELAVLQGHQSEVLRLAFSPDGRRLASGGNDPFVKIWNTANWKESTTLKNLLPRILGLAYSPNSQHLAVVASDRISIWEVGDHPQVITVMEQPQLTSVEFSRDGQTLATAGADRLVRTWNAKNGQPIATLTGHTDRVIDATFSPDGRTLASCGMDGTVRLWDLLTQEELAVLRDHTGQVNGVTFSPDGNQLSSVGAMKDSHGELIIRNAHLLSTGDVRP